MTVRVWAGATGTLAGVGPGIGTVDAAARGQRQAGRVVLARRRRRRLALARQLIGRGVLGDGQHLDVLEQDHRLIFAQGVLVEDADHVDEVAGGDQAAGGVQLGEGDRHGALAGRDQVGELLHVGAGRGR